MRERQPALCLGSFVTKRQKTGSAREETKGRTSLLPAFKAYPVRFELSEGGGQRGHARGDEGKDGLTQLISVALPFSFALATNRSCCRFSAFHSEGESGLSGAHTAGGVWRCQSVEGLAVLG